MLLFHFSVSSTSAVWFGFIVTIICSFSQDYAIETPLKTSSSNPEEQVLHEVQIDFDSSVQIGAIHFVLKVVSFNAT